MSWRYGPAGALCLVLAACGGSNAPADEPAEAEEDLVIVEESSTAGRLPPALISTGWPDLQTPVLPEQLGMTAEGLTDFRMAIASAVEARGAEGMTALLVRDGHVAAFVTAGNAPAGEALAGADTVWRSRVLAAPVITAGMLMLYDEGQFTLDEPAAYYLPEGRLGPVGSEEDSPTIAQIMTGDGTTGPDLNLQAEIIQNVSDTPVEVYLDERIFNQLGMTSMRLTEGAGGTFVLEASLRDMARFGQLLASGGGVGGARILDSATVSLMSRDHLPDDRWALNSGLGEDMTPGVIGRGLGVAVLRSAGVTGPGATAGSYFSAGEGAFLLIDQGQGLLLVGLSEGAGGRDGDAYIFRAAARAAYGAIAAD